MRILIVERESLIALDLEGTLERMGYEVIGCISTAADAIRVAETNAPDLALVSGTLKDGPVTPELISKLAQLGVPALLVSGAPEARKLVGAAGLIEKPFDPAHLVRVIEKVVSTKAR